MAFAIKIMTAKHRAINSVRSDLRVIVLPGGHVTRAANGGAGAANLLGDCTSPPGATKLLHEICSFIISAGRAGPAGRGARRWPPPGPLATTTWTHSCWAPMPRMSWARAATHREPWASPPGRPRRWPSTPTSALAASSPRRRCLAPRGTRCTRRAPTRCPRPCITTITTTPMCTPRRPWRRRRRTAVDREKQPSEGAFSENNPENESGGDKPPIDPSKCLLLPGRPPPPRRPPGSAGPPAFSGACLRLRWEPPEQRPGARSCCLGSLLGWGPPSPESSDKPACRASGEGRRRLPGEGAGQALRDDPRPGDPLLGLPGTKTEILWARFFESNASEKAFCAARLSGSGGSNCSPGSLTRDSGEDGRFSPLLASASGGVNPAQDAAAGDRDARVPVLDYSNKLEK
ncbi:homeobox protein Hox-A9 isoform X1 [Bos indicus x Bos taurus]|uniref:homeobox protein Hox-A9 isoform X1 n=1 Tax=Bos indicus x Bos taurus TaxID=30522 RepID=UPI000F7D482C|nr:homeobox protein Hox-A9 isoform X1 [Bos indicus x Bos taurus]